MGQKIFSVVIFTSNHFRRRTKKEKTHRRTDTQTQRERERERELEHEYTHKTQITPQPSQAPTSPAKLQSRRPTAQITRQPNTQDPQTPVHPNLSPPLPHHRSTSPIASHAPMSSDLNNRPQAMLHQGFQRTSRHHRSSIWPPPTTSPLHSTPPSNPLDLIAAASIHSDSLFPDLSFPQSLALSSPSH